MKNKFGNRVLLNSCSFMFLQV